MASDPGRDVRAKAFEFGVRTVRFVLDLPPRPGVRVLSDQLLRAGGGVGANLEEAKAASTRREFVRYVEIALRESRESLHWLRICSSVKLGDISELEWMLRRADELVRILTAIAVNTKRRMPVVVIGLLGTAVSRSAELQESVYILNSAF